MIEKSFGAAFNQLKHFGKAGVAAIIRVRRFAGLAIGEIQKQANIASPVWRRQFQQVCVVGKIHRQQIIKLIKISEFHFSRPYIGEVVTALSRRLDHAGVGRVAHMPGAGAGGIDGQPHAARPGLGAQDAFRRRRAADIAKTDEEDVFCHGCTLSPLAPLGLALL